MCVRARGRKPGRVDTGAHARMNARTHARAHACARAREHKHTSHIALGQRARSVALAAARHARCSRQGGSMLHLQPLAKGPDARTLALGMRVAPRARPAPQAGLPDRQPLAQAQQTPRSGHPAPASAHPLLSVCLPVEHSPRFAVSSVTTSDRPCYRGRHDPQQKIAFQLD